MMKRPMFAMAALVLSLSSAHAEPVPGKVADMIRAAVDGGDPAELAATVKIAKKTNPGSAAEIDALVIQLQADADARHHAELEQQGFFEGWTGQGQAGFSNATGNTHSRDSSRAGRARAKPASRMPPVTPTARTLRWA